MTIQTWHVLFNVVTWLFVVGVIGYTAFRVFWYCAKLARWQREQEERRRIMFTSPDPQERARAAIEHVEAFPPDPDDPWP